MCVNHTGFFFIPASDAEMQKSKKRQNYAEEGRRTGNGMEKKRRDNTSRKERTEESAKRQK